MGHADGEEYEFSQEVYESSPASQIESNLTLSQDAARAILGAPWRMATAEEYQELYDNCTSVWTTKNGVPGRLFTSRLNGNWIFLPAAGGYRGSSLNYRGVYGFYWSSIYSSATKARRMSFNISNIYPQNDDSRYYGFSVRAVCLPTT